MRKFTSLTRVSNRTKYPSGTHVVQMDASEFPTGSYIVRMNDGNRIGVSKLAIAK